MSPATDGLHHVTAIVGDPQRNAEFYVGALGLRLVKRTVNHDDTHTHHLYFGDRGGTPGTNITFFPWTDEGRQGQFGAGQARETAYLIRPDSLGYWIDRLEGRGIDVERIERFDETALRLTDPDGIGLELVASEAATEADAIPWPEGPVPAEHQLRGLSGVTLAVADPEPTAAVLTDVLGYERATEAGDRRRYRAAGGGPGAVLDLVETDASRGRMGVGTVHHVAFETTDVAEQERFREALAAHGLSPSEIIDRKYFSAVYAREPGGVLFEISTTGPGFTVDEDVEDLGSRLTLPEWLADEREEIEANLPPFDKPAAELR